MADGKISAWTTMPIHKYRSVEDMDAQKWRRPGLRLLVLHGSRARGTHRPDSDWDFAYLADPSFDPDALLAQLGEAFQSNDVDLADLSRASGLLRFKAAQEGRVLFESRPGAFAEFQLSAAMNWCDMEPVLRRAADAKLREVARGAFD